jgi:hypothetical protein
MPRNAGTCSRPRNLLSWAAAALRLSLLVLQFAPCALAASQMPEERGREDVGKLVAVSTFHSVGLYWAAATGGPDQVASVRYRPKGKSTWREAQDLWFDDRQHDTAPQRSLEYRGSIVNLKPGTEYEVESRINSSGERALTTVKTWSERFPVGRTMWQPPNATRTLVIRESGSPTGYVLYAPAPGHAAMIDVAGIAPFNIVIDASFIILRGLDLRNAGRHAILLRPGAHHVVIEENDISGWGRVTADGYGVDLDSGISNVESDGKERPSMPQIRSLVIQNNRIHHPRSSANHWKQYRELYGSTHPAGPQAITLWETGGNHVIRYNDIYSDDAHAFNDGVGGGENFGPGGAPGPDSDIYGNRISDCWDDGIESEGGNANVRIWGNLIDRCYVMIGASPVHFGPLYIFRNVAYRGRYSPAHNFNTGIFLKGQSREQYGRFWGGGRVYVYHNTLFRSAADAGTQTGISGVGTKLINYVSRNNILDNSDAALDSIGDDPRNDFDCDLYSGALRVDPRQERNGIRAEPQYGPSPKSGAFALRDGTRGQDDGCRLPGFNDDFAGKRPDRGAQESGLPALIFGQREVSAAKTAAGLRASDTRH